jgi:tRNA modification GTPase
VNAEPTIAALITGAGPAAVAIVRLSGADAFAIARRICGRWPDPLVPRRAFHATFFGDGQPFDSGLVLTFPGPASYTGEDVVELQGHGGHAARRLLEASVAAGARLAEPGEFTRRAYIAGRIDAVQAEAVALLIAAQTDRSLEVAQSNLGGALSATVLDFEEKLTGLRGRVEGLIDFAQEADGAEVGLAEGIRTLAGQVRALAATFSQGRRLFSRSEVVLVGPVNAGKSSLLNAMLGEERALVDAAPGTTRDLVHGDLELDGLPLRLVDTAGWREATGVEARGIAAGQAAAERAEVVLWVVDGQAPVEPPQAGWMRVWNKADLSPVAGAGWVAVSTRTGAGLEGLRAAIRLRLSAEGEHDERVVTTVRQAQALREAAEALDTASGQELLELLAEDLRRAAGALTRVRGGGMVDGVMDAVFAQFCIGK